LTSNTTLIGIDTGGTFTDFVLLREGTLRVHKALSTPRAPELAILQGIHDLGLHPAQLRVIHGSTVATNAALEGKGARTVYVGNRGLEDLLSIGRQARADLYDLQPPPISPPVPAELCLGTTGRLAADSGLLEPLTAADLTVLSNRVAALAPQAVAINLLYSYLDDTAERTIAKSVAADLFVACSSQVLPVLGEYERGIATWLTAWLGPLVQGYLERLRAGLSGARIAVMQSSGEAIAARQAGRQAVRMLLSGPAGGLVGARFVAGLAGRERLLTFDMGGTSTDVALVEGEPRLTREGRIGRWPVAVPMVDMHTIGAGGGSVARVDAGGLLMVGPESAGADPGPACYGRGGREPTVSDANLVLGRLVAEEFLGGRMGLDSGAARAALGRIAGPLDLSVEEAAQGVVRLADEHMARALRVISVQRGIDPRRHTLVSFGGAGGLHVCALAEALDMRQALVPARAGVLSALGMLAARPGRRLSRTWLGPLLGRSPAAVQADLDALALEGRRALEREGVAPVQITAAFSLDLRYRGQSYTLEVPWSGDPVQAAESFAALHQARYGHRLDLPVELVNLGAAVTGAVRVPQLPTLIPGGVPRPRRRVAVHGVAAAVPVLRREDLGSGVRIVGPAILVESVATTWLAAGWRCDVDGLGNLLLERC
jgi:N-methylhydantoinase A